ncbi:hypothetical protein, partial [Flavobacterium psychrophilum]|uniref:hypothetical protein n=1 Tax=Flavobacterium psychrophilum TaxID=96345 RepID=UPI001ABD3249
TQQPFGKMQNKSGIKIPQRKIKINIKPTLHEVLHFAKRQNVVVQCRIDSGYYNREYFSSLF